MTHKTINWRSVGEVLCAAVLLAGCVTDGQRPGKEGLSRGEFVAEDADGAGQGRSAGGRSPGRPESTRRGAGGSTGGVQGVHRPGN